MAPHRRFSQSSANSDASSITSGPSSVNGSLTSVATRRRPEVPFISTPQAYSLLQVMWTSVLGLQGWLPVMSGRQWQWFTANILLRYDQIIDAMTTDYVPKYKGFNRIRLNYFDVRHWGYFGRLGKSLTTKVAATFHYGKQEAFAQSWYARSNPNYELVQVHTLINPLLPFWTTKPDGIIFKSGKPVGLLEVKSMDTRCYSPQDIMYGRFDPLDFPFNGENIMFEPNNDNECILRGSNGEKTYYQIQFSLLISNLEWCDLVLVDDLKKTGSIYRIYRNDNFLANKLANSIPLQLKAMQFFINSQ